MSATAAKRNMSRLLDAAAAGNVIVITRRGTPAAVVISVAHFRALAEASAQSDLNVLLDAQYARM